jgi:nucleoside-diphosphate-sugar epimerase
MPDHRLLARPIRCYDRWMRVFLAGATGVIGRALVPLLIAAGHEVTGTTRSPERAQAIAQAGATAAVVDVFDAASLRRAVLAAKPDVVMHQLTDLPDAQEQLAGAGERNSRIRSEGTANLVEAARAADVPRMIAQSIAFIYAPGPQPHAETDPLASDQEGAGALTARGVRALERRVTTTPGIDGIVLRYARLYGPGTWHPDWTLARDRGYLHVDAAAHAAVLAMSGAPGIYNIAEDDGVVSIAKARRELGFDPAFRRAP